TCALPIFDRRLAAVVGRQAFPDEHQVGKLGKPDQFAGGVADSNIDRSRRLASRSEMGGKRKLVEEGGNFIPALGVPRNEQKPPVRAFTPRALKETQERSFLAGPS